MTSKTPSFELRLRVLSAVDYAPGDAIRARIQAVSHARLLTRPSVLIINLRGVQSEPGFTVIKNTASKAWTTEPVQIKIKLVKFRAVNWPKHSMVFCPHSAQTKWVYCLNSPSIDSSLKAIIFSAAN